jgi:hypothetical protein
MFLFLRLVCVVEPAVSCVLLNAGFREGDDGEGVGCGLEWLGAKGRSGRLAMERGRV